MSVRVAEVNALLAGLLAERAGGGPLAVVVGGSGAVAFADALAGALAPGGGIRVGTSGPADVLIHLRGERGSGSFASSAMASIAPTW